MKKKQSKAPTQPVRDLGLKASRVGRHVKHATAAGPKAEQKRAAEERERAGATKIAPNKAMLSKAAENAFMRFLLYAKKIITVKTR